MAASNQNGEGSDVKNFETIFASYWNEEATSKPKCIVFDLDYTLWPFFVDQHLTPPFTVQTSTKSSKTGTTTIHDHRGKLIEPYTEVNAILELLEQYRFKNPASRLYLAIASRSSTPNDSAKVMDLLGWTRHFDSVQIYPCGKQKHLTEIKNELGIRSFKEMLFYDDTLSSIKAANQVDVAAHKLNRTDGLTFKELMSGLRLFAKARA